MELKCRTCSCEIQDEIAINVFTCKNSEESIADMLMLFAPISIRKEDELPKTMCLNCFAKLNISYDFRKSVLTSDIELKQQIMRAKHKDCEITSQNIYSFSFAADEDNSKMLIDENDVDMDIFEVTARTESISLDNDDSIDEIFVETIEIASKDETKLELDQSETDNVEKHVFNEEIVAALTKTDTLQKWGFSSKFCVSKRKKASEIDKNICLKCGKRFKGLLQLKLHNFTHLSKKEIICFDCNARFADKKHFLWHFRARHSKNPENFPCNVCGDPLKDSKTFLDHDKKHLNNENVKFERFEDFSKNHKSEKHNQCRHCGRKFDLIKEKRYKCSRCDLKFKRKERFVRHLRKHSTKKNKSQQCDNQKTDRNCKKSFQCTNCCRKYHIKVDLKKVGTSNKKLFKCNYCSLEFDKRIALNRHIKSHTGKNPHKCVYCGKKFMRVNTMNRHILRIHKKSKRKRLHHCKHCGKKLKPII